MSSFVWTNEYGPLLKIYEYLDDSEIVKIKIVSKTFKVSAKIFYEGKRWKMKELFSLNTIYREKYRLEVWLNKKMKNIDILINSVYEKTMLRIDVFYTDTITSDSQKRILPLIVPKNLNMLYLKNLFVLIYGNWPYRHGLENYSGEPHYWGVNGKMFEEIQFLSKSDDILSNDILVKNLSKQYVHAKVVNIIPFHVFQQNELSDVINDVRNGKMFAHFCEICFRNNFSCRKQLTDWMPVDMKKCVDEIMDAINWDMYQNIGYRQSITGFREN